MLICDEENQILALLNACPDRFFSPAEVCRKGGNRKLVAKDPRWALPFLVSLKDKDLVEADPNGHYRLFIRNRDKED
jgi:hypothetical protein